jgi:guanine nucleotide-binding protein subunit beta-2-like 1 protein
MVGHSHFVSSLALSRDSKYVVSGSWDKTLRLWDLNTFKTKKIFVGHEKDVLSVAFSDNNRIILSGGMDKTLRYWNIKGESKYVAKEFNGWVSCMTHVKQDKQTMLAVGSWDQQVRVFNQDYKFTSGISDFDYGIISMASDEDGEFLFCAEKNGVVKVHNLLDDGKTELKSTVDINSEIHAISFESKYYMAISCATRDGLVVNEVSKPNRLYQSNLGGGCTSLAWDESKTYLFAGFMDGGIRVYRFTSKSD